jgi:hypothetical protein
VTVTVGSGDHERAVRVDAAPWFGQAMDDWLEAWATDGWGSAPWPSFSCANWLASHGAQDTTRALQSVFDYCRVRGQMWWCTADEGEAARWLWVRRPTLAAALRLAGRLGEAG